MKREIVVVVLSMFFLISCSGRKTEGGAPAAAADSSRGADTAAVQVPVRVLSYEERQGEIIYGRYCAVCHGDAGKGDGFNAYNLDPRPRDFSDSLYMKALGDEQIVQTITGGGRSANKSPLMPAYGWTLDRGQIRYLQAYIRTFSRP